MKKNWISNHIVSFGKAHWQICAVSLFFILTGIVCGRRLFTTLDSAQKQRVCTIAFLLEHNGSPFFQMILRRALFFGIQCCLSTYLICVPLCAGTEVFHIAWRTICWILVFERQNGMLTLFNLPLAAGCFACDYLRCIYTLMYTLDFYKKQYRELHVPKAAREVMHSSFLYLRAMARVYIWMLPIWCLEIAAWI